MILPPSEWYCDPELWEVNRSFIWSPKRIEMSRAAAANIATLMEMQPSESILDLACGFGRHSLELSRQGYTVTGVDLNPNFIQEASSKALDLGLDANFQCADMREYIEPDGFENIIIMYNSFGYFLDPQDDQKVLQNCLLSLKPGGKLLVSVTPRVYIMKNRSSRQFRYWHEEDNGTIRLEEAIANDDWTWDTTRWIILKGGERREFTYGIRLYDKLELCNLLSSVGFIGIRPFGSISGLPFSEESHHLILTSQKPI